jgi:hypothetical protein
MVGDLAGDKDDMVGRGVAGRDKERTSPEPKMARLAATSPAEARKGT